MDQLVPIIGPSKAAPAGAPSEIGAAFRSCESYLTAGLRRMQDRGEHDTGTVHGELATGLIAAYQGGYLFSQAAPCSRPMAVAPDLALDSIEARRARGDRASGAAS
jgi:TetR/AcrR family transcriptional regulator, transcriptional repressor for nem operon